MVHSIQEKITTVSLYLVDEIPKEDKSMEMGGGGTEFRRYV